MMFGYEVNEHVTLKILEEREAEQLFKLVDSNRDYLGEFSDSYVYSLLREEYEKVKAEW